MSPLERPGRAARRNAEGVTLTEITVWALLAGLIGSPLVLSFLTSTRSMTEIDAFGRVHERLRVALFRMEHEVRRAIVGTIQIGGGGMTLSFTLPLGFTEVGVRPGGAVRYELGTAPGENANGIDDNGNGLVDEGQLGRRDLVTGENVALCSGLDLAGCRFARDGDAVVLTLTTQGYLPHSQAVVARFASRTVNPRN